MRTAPNQPPRTTPTTLLTLLALLTPIIHLTHPTTTTAQTTRSQLGANIEPGAMYLEDLLPKPVRLTVTTEAPIYYQIDMQRVLGSMAPGTPVQLIAMSEHGYRIRGRARHGDVAGWMHRNNLQSTDPKLPEKLKAFYERQKQVETLIAENQVAIGMTVNEVKASLGNPSRKSSRLTATGREETLEYIIYDRVPQITTGRDRFGNLVQTTIYVKIETGRLTIAFKDNIVTEISETQGNPLGTGGIKLLPIPITIH